MSAACLLGKSISRNFDIAENYLFETKKSKLQLQLQLQLQFFTLFDTLQNRKNSFFCNFQNSKLKISTFSFNMFKIGKIQFLKLYIRESVCLHLFFREIRIDDILFVNFDF